MSELPEKLDPAQFRQIYDEQGFIVAREVIDLELVQAARAHLADLLERIPAFHNFSIVSTPVIGDPFWVKLVADNRLLDLVGILFGPDLALYSVSYIVKKPGEAGAVLWHQDEIGWKLDPMEVLTLWVALDETSLENGCLEMLPGTHRGELLPHSRDNLPPNVFGLGIDPALIETERAVPVLLKPGDVSLHHPRLIHGSAPNRTGQNRTGVIIRYIPATTRIITDNPWHSTVMLRGEPKPGINVYQTLNL